MATAEELKRSGYVSFGIFADRVTYILGWDYETTKQWVGRRFNAMRPLLLAVEGNMVVRPEGFGWKSLFAGELVVPVAKYMYWHDLYGRIPMDERVQFLLDAIHNRGEARNVLPGAKTRLKDALREAQHADVVFLTDYIRAKRRRRSA